MRKTVATEAIVALALALSACGKPAEDNAADTAAPASAETSVAPSAGQASADAGGSPAAFAQCAVCHSTEAGKNGVGPSLAGVFGRKAGTVAGFAYSDANKNSGLTWDEQTLDTYLTNPMKMVPGTKMTFAGIPDAARRKDVIAYLKTLK